MMDFILVLLWAGFVCLVFNRIKKRFPDYFITAREHRAMVDKRNES
jgi:hypothetical protein